MAPGLVVDANFRSAVEAAVAHAVSYILTTPLPSSLASARRSSRRWFAALYRRPWWYCAAAAALLGFSVSGLENGAPPVRWSRRLRQAGGVARAAELIADRLGERAPFSEDATSLRQPAPPAGRIDRRRF